MQTTYTAVLARRVRISGDFSTLPYEAGWANEAVFFTQVEGEHPELSISTEISPDGINWLRRGQVEKLGESEHIAANALTVFGNWMRLVITGATPEHTARVLVHVSLKG
ncbi:hypothetical protein [Dactylosporangium salmoneum]|uniref:Uncharacterized protein n=1 Tax=Dactylosporangium salmoneum TaxID=53361 RepID=A0ABP5UTY6_9ACTN